MSKITFQLRTVRAIHSDKIGEKVTYRMISDKTGIAVSTLSKISTNAQAMISLDVLARLCDFFDCQPGDLFLRRATAAVDLDR